MATAEGIDVIKYVCSALGVDDTLVQSIQINVGTDSIATVTIERYIDKRELEMVVETFNIWDKEIVTKSTTKG